jgi:hypothetical protein
MPFRAAEHLAAMAAEQHSRAKMWDAIARGIDALVELAKNEVKRTAERREKGNLR